MDPNIALDKLREMCAEATQSEEGELLGINIFDVTEAFEALDQWLSNGGFLPSEWQDARKL